jgi:ribosomal protein L32
VRKWLIILACLAYLALPASVRAQAPIRFSAVTVDIWPEYDRPSVLVIDHLTLDAAAVLPAQVTLRVPARAQVWAVAVVDASGGRINAPYNLQVQGDWAVLSITANSPSLQIEYYDPLVKNGTSRRIEYQWAGDAAIDSFGVVFQQPAGATDLALAPAAQSSSVDKGLTYYRTAPVALAAGQTYSLVANYQKQNDDLTISSMPVEPAQPFGQNTFGNMWINGVTNVILIGLGGLLVAGAVIGVIFWRRNSPKSAARRRHVRSGNAEQGPEEAVYCSQCGKRAQPGDVFCRTCGERLGRRS